MNFHQLKVFDSVARSRSFSKAAKELDLSQPTVSVHLQKLQSEIEVILVEQLGKTLHLTPAGQILFGYTQRIFSLAREAEQALEDLKGLNLGRINIGASTTPGTYLLPQVLARFKTEHPEVELNYEMANSSVIAGRVLANHLDFGIVGHNLPGDANLVTTPLWDDKLVLIISPQNPLAQLPNITIRDFVQQPLILREPGSGTRLVMEQGFANLGVSLHPCMEISGTEGVKQIVAANLGIGMVSNSSISGELLTGTLVAKEIYGLDLRRQFYLIQHKDKYLSPLLTLFLTYLETQ